MIGITILGATGSVGASTLEVLARHRDKYRVVALTARNNVEKLYQQCRVWQPDYAVMQDAASAARLSEYLATSPTTVLAGSEGLIEAATLKQCDFVMAAIVGAAGLAPTLAAANAGKRILLANKESLIMSGQLLLDAVNNSGCRILPVDSEHNALFQCMPPGYEIGTRANGVRRLLLTASGGPFRTTPLPQFEHITPEQACAHPNWDMGAKISVDSATMMNKGLELIEAGLLFGFGLEKLEVLIHPQSVVHSLVEYEDGSVLAQLGNPDMRTPIANVLAWPERIDAGVDSLNLSAIGHLDFSEPDQRRFPCLGLAMHAMAAGGTAPAVLNAANEIAVQAFLQSRIRFSDIAVIVESVLEKTSPVTPESLAVILEHDAEARRLAMEKMEKMQKLYLEA